MESALVRVERLLIHGTKIVVKPIEGFFDDWRVWEIMAGIVKN